MSLRCVQFHFISTLFYNFNSVPGTNLSRLIHSEISIKIAINNLSPRANLKTTSYYLKIFDEEEEGLSIFNDCNIDVKHVHNVIMRHISIYLASLSRVNLQRVRARGICAFRLPL